MKLSLDELRRREFRKILLIKLSAVGDVVHTLPVLNKLRRRYPNAQIDWLVTPAIGELLRHHPALNSVIDFERDTSAPPWAWSALTNYARLASKLRSIGYDLAIDLHCQSRTAFLAFISGAPVRIGFDKQRSEVWAHSRRVTDDFRKHAWHGAREGAWLFSARRIPLPTLRHPFAGNREHRDAQSARFRSGTDRFLVPDSTSCARPCRHAAARARRRRCAARGDRATRQLADQTLAGRKIRRDRAPFHIARPCGIVGRRAARARGRRERSRALRRVLSTSAARRA